MKVFQVLLNKDVTEKYEIPYQGLILKGENLFSASQEVTNYLKKTFKLEDEDDMDLCVASCTVIEIDENEFLADNLRDKYEW